MKGKYMENSFITLSNLCLPQPNVGLGKKPRSTGVKIFQAMLRNPEVPKDTMTTGLILGYRIWFIVHNCKAQM